MCIRDRLGDVHAEKREGEIVNGRLSYDPERRELKADGELVKLTATELKIVDLLMRNPGRVFPAEEIYQRVWQSDSYACENTVMVHIRRIREKIGAVDKVSLCSALPTKKDAHWRHPAYFIIRFRFNAVADKRQWSSAASKPRRKTRAKLCSRFCAENEPSHQTCRSFSASRYSGLERRSRLRCRSAAK